jgi:hypothetical protein
MFHAVTALIPLIRQKPFFPGIDALSYGFAYLHHHIRKLPHGFSELFPFKNKTVFILKFFDRK